MQNEELLLQPLRLQFFYAKKQGGTVMRKNKTNNSPEKREAAGTPKRNPRTPVPSKGKQETHLDFPIVGIGASAGGLEALELFLRTVPPESGMAFIIVQHLDPTHKGIMVELLQRATSMPVVQIKDRMKVEPERVYVIP